MSDFSNDNFDLPSFDFSDFGDDDGGGDLNPWVLVVIAVLFIAALIYVTHS